MWLMTLLNPERWFLSLMIGWFLLAILNSAMEWFNPSKGLIEGRISPENCASVQKT